MCQEDVSQVEYFRVSKLGGRGEGETKKEDVEFMRIFSKRPLSLPRDGDDDIVSYPLSDMTWKFYRRERIYSEIANSLDPIVDKV